MVITTVAVPRATETLDADVDGDGTDDVISVVEQPMDDGSPGLLDRAADGDGRGGHAGHGAGRREQARRQPIDLDGDGDLEIIVSFSGGEAFWAEVYTWEDGTLVSIKIRDAAGGDRLAGDGVEPTDWQLAFLPDGIYSWRYADPAATDRPAIVEVRTWTLEGRTLTQSTQSVPGCVDAEFALSLRRC